MTKLATLRTQLRGLRQARSAVRAATAWSSLATAVLWALAGVLLLDLAFELEIVPRVVVMALAAAAVAWAFVRFTRPLIGRRETEIDMALLVERQQQIDSDLVAALQFESPDAARWGSPQLESAVIDYVAAVGRGINVFDGFSREQMARRGLVLAITAVTLLALAAIFPGHTAAFFNRLLLGSMHYPARTQIRQVIVGGQSVLVSGEHGSRPVAIKAAQGRPVTFLVAAGGSLPAKGSVRLQALTASTRTSIDLTQLTQAQAQQQWPASTPLPEGAVYIGQLPRLLESVSYQVFLGDGWTDAAAIAMVPLPTVETRITAVPPRYARTGGAAPDPASRQVSVLEGTTLKLAVQCTNKKPLRAVWMTVPPAGDKVAWLDLVQQDDAGLIWALPEKGSPLANIRSEVRYEVEVRDADGLGLDTPIRGSIRIRPDRLPSGSADVVHKVVLPTAEPVIEYRAADDYGLSRIALVAQVERVAAAEPGGPASDVGQGDLGQGVLAAAQEIPAEIHRFDLHDGGPLLADRLPMAGRYGLSLSPLQLAKGDRVKLTLEVTDYRGENDQGQPVGQSTTSDALVLEISDESGVLAAISEADERSEQRLTDIIRRQLGIGETPKP